MAHSSQKKNLKTKGRNAVLVTVSALALSAAPYKNANAVVQINCPGANNIQVGQHIACGNGSIRIVPAGGIVTVGCLHVFVPAQQGTCTINNVGAPTTRNVRVEFPTATVTYNDGGNSIQLDNFRMRRTSGAGLPLPAITFSSGEVNGTTRINIGATIRFTQGSSIGNYVGTVNITATPQ